MRHLVKNVLILQDLLLLKLDAPAPEWKNLEQHIQVYDCKPSHKSFSCYGGRISHPRLAAYNGVFGTKLSSIVDLLSINYCDHDTCEDS